MKETLHKSWLSTKESIDKSLKSFVEEQLLSLEKSEKTESTENSNDRVVFDEALFSLYEKIVNQENDEVAWWAIDKKLRLLQSNVFDTIIREWRNQYISFVKKIANESKISSSNYLSWPLLDQSEEMFWWVVSYLRKKDSVV